MRSGVSCFNQRRSQPLAALAGLATQAFASTFMVAGTHACPRGQVLSTGELLHLWPNLGQDVLRSTPLDARNGFEAQEDPLVGLKPLGNLATEPIDGLL